MLIIILFQISLIYSLNNDCAFRTTDECLNLNIYQSQFACHIKKNRCVQNKQYQPHYQDEFIHFQYMNKHESSNQIRGENTRRKTKNIIERIQSEIFSREEVPLSISHSYSWEDYGYDNYQDGIAFEYENLAFEDEESSLEVVQFDQQKQLEQEKFFQIVPLSTNFLLLGFSIIYLQFF